MDTEIINSLKILRIECGDILFNLKQSKDSVGESINTYLEAVSDCLRIEKNIIELLLEIQKSKTNG